MASRNTPIGSPTKPRIGAHLERVDADAFSRHSRWEDVYLLDADLALLEANLGHLSGTRIEGGDVGDARLVSLSLDDCELLRVNAANAHAERAILRRVALHEVRMTGLDLGDADLRHVLFRSCRSDLVSFNGARLTDVAFEDCVLRDVDLRGTRLERVRFERCDLSMADLTGAEFKRCEMRGCTLERVRGGLSLSGVAMPWEDVVANAGVFAGAVGVVPTQEPTDDAD